MMEPSHMWNDNQAVDALIDEIITEREWLGWKDAPPLAEEMED